jgi:hypothetical protein
MNFNKEVLISDIKESYRDFIIKLCNGKKTLHIGCFDDPIFDPNNNLHINLSSSSSILHGLDIVEGYDDEMKKYYDGIYFTDYKEVNENYDIIIVPEVIEHSSNPGLILDAIFKIHSDEYFITAPNAYSDRLAYYDDGVFYETIHDGHVAWYSPYTLKNLIKPYVNDNYEISMYFLSNSGSVAIDIKKIKNI